LREGSDVTQVYPGHLAAYGEAVAPPYPREVVENDLVGVRCDNTIFEAKSEAGKRCQADRWHGITEFYLVKIL
jgi:hypothetical protein